MLCDICKSNEASVFLTQIIDGKSQNVNLCDSCSKEYNVTDPTGFALADLLLGLGAGQEIQKGAAGSVCPICGFTQADFKKTGRLGCSACYDVFPEQLTSLLKAVHKGTHHTGKIPARQHQSLLHRDRLKSLQDDLDHAIHDEDYEKAATLRDQIRDLPKEGAHAV